MFFRPGCPTSTLALGLCPPTPAHSHTVGMLGAAGTDPAQPPHSSPLPAGPTAISNIPIPSLHQIFSPQCAWNSLAVVSKAHLWLCVLDPTSALALGWIQGCVFLLFPRCCCWGSSPGTEGEPRAMLCSSFVHPSGDAR